jgi:hypothetical protein
MRNMIIILRRKNIFNNNKKKIKQLLKVNSSPGSMALNE